MNTTYYLFILLAFLAVVLALEGGYILWNNYKGSGATQIRRRLQVMAVGSQTDEAAGLLKQRLLSKSAFLQRTLARIPRSRELDRLLEQAGMEITVARFLGMSLACAVVGLLVCVMLRLPVPMMVVGAALAGLVPLQRLISARRRRLDKIEEQLPDALDLMSRSLRAGHAFSGALQMVSTEASQPIAGEFRIVFDEINFGIPAQDALVNLATRVPSTDLRYFVVAVLIQRETGGNLAEVLNNLSSLIRARFKLRGTIKALSAEGRLSAWVLAVLPFAVAFVMYMSNPRFMSVLWNDPAGPKLILGVIVLMLIGIAWMWRMVKIRL